MDEIKIPPAVQQLDPKNWVKAYADYLYLYTISRVNDEEQARDLVQETFLAGLQSMRNFSGKSSERTWLTAILKNKIFDVYRKRASGLKTEDMTNAMGEEPDFFHEDGHWRKEHAPQQFGIDDFETFAKKELNKTEFRLSSRIPVLIFI